jgi:hypothetical protein
MDVNMAPRWQAAWWPEMSHGGAMSGSEHGSTLASSVVAGVREVISATVASPPKSSDFGCLLTSLGFQVKLPAAPSGSVRRELDLERLPADLFAATETKQAHCNWEMSGRIA